MSHRKRKAAVAVKGSPVNAVLYVRVSSKDQEKEGFSLEAQEHLLREYCSSRGLQVVHLYKDVETAKKAGRTAFGEMVSFLRRQQRLKSSGPWALVVEKTDRLYRNFKDYITVDELGVEVHLVKEGEILSEHSNSHAKLVHSIKVVLAKQYIDNLSEETRKGLLEKARQGIFPAKAPLGYMNFRDESDARRPISHIVMDPKAGPVVARIFEMYASGRYSLEELVRFANRELLPQLDRKTRIIKSTLHQMLTNPFYYGVFIFRNQEYRGTHQPLITKDLYDLVQEKLIARSQAPGGYNKHDWLFRGLVKCGHCGCSLTAERKKGKYVYYHCTGNKGNCGEPYVPEAKLSAAFLDALQAIQLSPEWQTVALQAVRESFELERRDHTNQLTKLQVQYQKLKDRMDCAYDDKLDGRISQDLFDQKYTEWKAEQELVVRRIDALRYAGRHFIEDTKTILELAEAASDLYKRQNEAEKRRLLEIVFSNSQWKGGQLIPIYREPFAHLASARMSLVGTEGVEDIAGGQQKRILPRLDSNQ